MVEDNQHATSTAAEDEPEAPRAEEQFDPERVRAFLGASGAMSLRQFRKGHSNLTYLLQFGDRELVLRRAPLGAAIKSAHDMGREFKILTALHGAYPKAPRPVAFCDDESLIGARFYVMERVHGVVLRGQAPPPGVTFTPELLRATSAALLDNLADLHAVELGPAVLGTLGHPQGYVARQVSGWSGRYAKAQTDDLADLTNAAAWLAQHLPAEPPATLIHNDYKYDNVMLDPQDLTRIVAVLDWEMATVGDPLSDLGQVLGYWIDADDPAELRARPYGPTFLPGTLTRAGLVERYGQRTGRDTSGILFYYVLALFKIAVILQQIYKRFVDGHTRDPRFGALIHSVRLLARQSARALAKGRIDGLGSA